MALRKGRLVILLMLGLPGCSVGQFFGGSMPGGMPGGGMPGGKPDREYYDVLGVDPRCSDAEIRRAFREKAKHNHPDKGGDPEVFKKVNEAWQVLSDPEKRQAYDTQCKAAVDGSYDGMPGGSLNVEELLRMFLKDLRDPFGGLGPVQLGVTLEELYTGVTKRIDLGRGMQIDVSIEPGLPDGEALQLRTRAGTAASSTPWLWLASPASGAPPLL